MHRDRLAVVYIRQSTPQQVLDHQESTRLQYGLVGRAQAFGWSADRILVIDDDLGKSGSSAAGRSGFQHLVSEVSLNHVGLILGIEISRLARSCKDWHQLLELCALFGTLIADSDGMYDPTHYNDRLLLGLKGTMSEAELHIIKQRMQQGKLNKARRGELGMPVPTGYLRRPSGEVIFDPDEQVQAVVQLVFRKFRELRTLNAVLRYLVRHDIQLGIRVRSGLCKGDLAWHRPNRMTLQNLLKNPIYAGAYAYGRRQVDLRKQQPGRPSTGRVVMDPNAWLVLIPDQYPAYIAWAEYEANLAQLQANQTRADEVGTPRTGPALLAGVIVCGLCGRRMSIQYGGVSNRHTYCCSRGRADYALDICQSVAGPPIDTWVSCWLLTALEPAAIEIALAAAQQREVERAELDHIWQQRRERAAYDVSRAERQYQVAEPENRLVVRQLERAWEAALVAQQAIEETYDRFLQEHPRLLSAGVTEQVQIMIEWVGGSHTEALISRPVGRLEQLSYYPQLCERVRALASAGLGPTAIAAQLNEDGYRPPKRRERFGRQGVVALLQRLGLRRPQARSVQRDGLGADEWWVATLAQRIGMPEVTLHHWIRRQWVQAHQQAAPPYRWIIWADEAEVTRLCQLHALPAGTHTRRLWVDDGQTIQRFPVDTTLNEHTD